MTYNLVISKKTGFVANSPFTIYDERGKIFYSDSFTEKLQKFGKVYFNMPKGYYSLTGKIYRLNNPVKHRKIKLPPFERHFKERKLEIQFGTNPNKASIFWKNNVILFDNSFLEKPKYILFDIYFHELGHRFYKSEHLADLYATKRLLQLGFNKSQIGRSIVSTLSDRSHYRKVLKINTLNHV